MKNYYLPLLLLFCSMLSLDSVAQCPNEFDENKLNGQAEVDAFLQNNPDCTYLFELELRGDVVDISGFSQLRSLSYLYILDCPLLNDLYGLHQVDSIFGNLGFSDCEGITNLCGLEQVRYIGNDLRIEDCISVVDLQGLGPITAVGDDIEVRGNQNLKSLDGLQNINAADGLTIIDNPTLNNCCGVQNLLSSGNPINWLDINNNPMSCNTVEEILAATCKPFTDNCITTSISTETIEMETIRVFPNPVEQSLQIKYPADQKLDQLRLFDLLGRQCMEIDQPNMPIELPAHLSGMYVLELRLGQQKITKRLLIQ